jgi:hypothetical protein
MFGSGALSYNPHICPLAGKMPAGWKKLIAQNIAAAIYLNEFNL